MQQGIPRPKRKTRTTIIAPMIRGQSRCDEAIGNPSIKSADEANALCNRLGKNGAKGIARTLDALGPVRSPSGRFELGYTLILPLLRFYASTNRGWRIDQHAIDVALSTIEEIDRPVVLHLSATHFNFEGKALAAELARDVRNLMWTKDGPLVSEKYFRSSVHAWTLVDSDAPVNRYRREAFNAVVRSICRLPHSVRRRIAAVTFLGETHQLFPDLEGAGPSFFNGDYIITDYSPAARDGFRNWLRARFKTIHALNRQIGGQFADFREVDPPSESRIGDAVPDRLRHLDESAAGSIAIVGWAAGSSAPPPKVSIYVDGNLDAEVSANLSRLDVLDARPEFGTSNVGFRYDLDYTGLSCGEHTVTLLVAVGTSPPYFLGERKVDILGNGGTSAPDRSGVLPRARALDSELSAYIDHPAPALRVLYNPLAKLWNEYRYDQATRFLEQFAQIAANSGIPRNKLFSHQIAAAFYPEYNEEKIGSASSLKPNPYYNPGVTMYGGCTYGDQFFDYKTSIGWTSFGIGEFNPLVKLSPSEYRTMFLHLNAAGAAYIAPFHMETFSDGTRDEKLISRTNLLRGNREFYQAISDLMHNE